MALENISNDLGKEYTSEDSRDSWVQRSEAHFFNGGSSVSNSPSRHDESIAAEDGFRFSAKIEQHGPVIEGPGAKRARNDPLAPTRLTRTQQSIVDQARKYAMEQQIKDVLIKQTQKHQITQMMNLQATQQKQQALALMCRIYVGNINFDIYEDTVKTAFLPFGPMRSLSLAYDNVAKKHKGYSFIDYETPEAAQLALEQMNGVMMGGRNIKVGRPSNMPQAQPIIAQMAEEAKNYNRVYIASIHPALGENDIRSVFEAFGKITSCQLAIDSMRPGKHKGFAFVEYETLQSAQEAISSMNLFDLGGQFLRVGRAVTPPDITQQPISMLLPSSLPMAAAVAAAAVTAKITAMDAVSQVQGLPPPGLAIPQLGGMVQPAIVLPEVLGRTSGFGPAPQAAASVVQPPVMQSLQSMQATLNSLGFSGAGISQPMFGAMMASSAAMAQALVQASVVGPTMSAHANVPVVHASIGLTSPQLTMAPVQPTFANTLGLNLKPSAGFGEGNGPRELTEAQKRLLDEDGGQLLDKQENIETSGREARHVLMQKLMSRGPGLEHRVMILRNMVGPEEVDDDLKFEVTDECAKYGDVKSVVIYQEKQDDDDEAEIVVKIFVEFSAQQEMNKAIQALNGRFFGGRQVKASPYDQDLFFAKDYSG